LTSHSGTGNAVKRRNRERTTWEHPEEAVEGEGGKRERREASTNTGTARPGVRVCTEKMEQKRNTIRQENRRIVEKKSWEKPQGVNRSKKEREFDGGG